MATQCSSSLMSNVIPTIEKKEFAFEWGQAAISPAGAITTRLTRSHPILLVEDFVSLLSRDFTTPTNNILGVWYHEASGIKCYKIFSPTRSLLIFIYESPEGSMETANAILEAVNYGKDQVVAEDGTRYSVRWEGADTMVVTYTMEGKRHREQWTRSQLPTYLSGLFMSLGTN